MKSMEDIIKALKCVSEKLECEECPYQEHCGDEQYDAAELLIKLDNVRKVQARMLNAQKERMKFMQEHINSLKAANAAFGLGADRLKKLEETYWQVFQEYAEAELAVSDGKDDPDIVYTRAKVDQKLQQIIGENFRPWEDRYGG